MNKTRLPPREDLNRTIRARTRTVIRRQNVVISAIARRVGKSPSTVKNWTSGPNEMKLADAARFCVAYGVSLDWLAGIERDTVHNPSDTEVEILGAPRVAGYRPRRSQQCTLDDNSMAD